MSWVSDVEGPYYIRNSMKEAKKFDKSNGTTKEVHLNMDEMILPNWNIGVNARENLCHFSSSYILSDVVEARC